MEEIKARKAKPTPAGWVISIGGLLIGVFIYVLSPIGGFFADMDGTAGLDEMAWTMIGGMIWIFVIMGILTPLMLKYGVEYEDEPGEEKA